jgi:hypothetical protein
MLSIEDRIWDGQRASSSAQSAGWYFVAREPSDGFAHAELGLGMMSKRHRLKDTFGFETHLML